MEYPFWDTSLGYGALMAAISVLHVFISHFAIGGGLYLVLNEVLARRRREEALLEYLERLTRLFVLVTLVLGALTGVGIWFIIGLLNPAATEVLIHHFVWAWATEWTFFLVEITAAILYYYGWRRMPASAHIVLGWIYFIAAWLSLFVINGIITFMLTPGSWLQTGSFWDGFFNPTFLPSLLFRTGIALLLAGLYTLLVAARRPEDDLKGRLVRRNALWGVLGLVLMAPSFYWYWSALPDDVVMAAEHAMRIPMESLTDSLYLAAALFLLLLVLGFVAGRRTRAWMAVVAMVLGFLYFGAFEMFRESVRKPFVIAGYMYGNGIEVAMADVYRKDGLLEHLSYRSGDDGADLFRHACRSCHTVDGFRPLAPALAGTDTAFIEALVRHTDALKGNMPPFTGSGKEARRIAEHLRARMDTRPLGDIYGLQGVALGRKVYEIRCGVCHEFGGFRDNLDAIRGLDRSDYEDLLDEAGDYDEAMPPFTGEAPEREALIQYLLTLR